MLQYLPMLRRHNPSLPVVLVGCQGDNKVECWIVTVMMLCELAGPRHQHHAGHRHRARHGQCRDARGDRRSHLSQVCRRGVPGLPLLVCITLNID